MSRLSKRNKLIADYRDFVDRLVPRLVQSMGLSRAYHDEYVAAGYLGLVEAAERYDPKKGEAGFKSFAFHRIRGAVIDSIRLNSQLSGRAYRYAKALSAVNSLEEVSQDASVRGGNKSPASTLAGILDMAANGAIAFQLAGADGPKDPMELESPRATPDEALETKEGAVLLRRVVNSLPHKERAFIKGIYYRDEGLTRVGETRVGVSKSWGSRLHHRALGMVKERYLEMRDEEPLAKVDSKGVRKVRRKRGRPAKWPR